MNERKRDKKKKIKDHPGKTQNTPRITFCITPYSGKLILITNNGTRKCRCYYSAKNHQVCKCVTIEIMNRCRTFEGQLKPLKPETLRSGEIESTKGMKIIRCH